MNISPITNFIKPKLNFTSTARTEYYAKNTLNGDTFIKESYNPFENEVKNSNFSVFFRDDIEDNIFSNWNTVIREICEKLPKDKKINIYDFACSDGSEAYSLIISLIETLGEKEAERFLPIKAFDKDKEIIKRAKSNFIFADKNDIERIKRYTNDNLEKYFYVAKEENGQCLLVVRPILSSNVVFKQAKIQDEIKNLNEPNSLIFARNMWKYLPEDERISSFKEMYDTIDSSSKLLLGAFDFHKGGKLPVGLAEAGFTASDISDYSFEKR